MGKNESYEDEEMTVELELEDGTVVNCAVITILTVEAKDYIVLLPLDEDGETSRVGGCRTASATDPFRLRRCGP